MITAAAAAAMSCDAKENGSSESVNHKPSTDVVVPDEKNKRPPRAYFLLYEAVEDGSVDDVRAALDSGVNIRELSKHNFAGETFLHYAVMQGHYAITEALLDGGSDVNAKSDSGLTALHRTAYYSESRASIASLLLKKGADVEARDEHGLTVLDYAARNGHDDIIELIRRRPVIK